MPESYFEIDRSQVPEGSFRYGQFVSEGDFAVPADCWAVCTACYRANGERNFDRLLVAQFLFTNESEARYTARTLREGDITLVHPKP